MDKRFGRMRLLNPAALLMLAALLPAAPRTNVSGPARVARGHRRAEGKPLPWPATTPR